MQTEELRQLMRRRPFEPFRLHLADGRVFDITKPYIHLLRQEEFDIGIPTDDGPLAVAAYWETVPIEDIRRVEMVPAAASPSGSRP